MTIQLRSGWEAPLHLPPWQIHLCESESSASSPMFDTQSSSESPASAQPLTTTTEQQHHTVIDIRYNTNMIHHSLNEQTMKLNDTEYRNDFVPSYLVPRTLVPRTLVPRTLYLVPRTLVLSYPVPCVNVKLVMVSASRIDQVIK